MSRQRKKHQDVVQVGKRRKLIDKVLSSRKHFVEIMKMAQSAFGLPPYQGTKYRGSRRWFR
jgi:CO dehydrogenase/acetyl-CoA synthase epsilon subunit